MMKKIVCLLICLTAMWPYAQNLEFEKANFPNQKEELREALKKLEQGAELYQAGRNELEEQRRQFVMENKFLPMSLHDYQRAGYQQFKSATPALLEALRFNPRNAAVNYMLGVMLLFQEPLSKQTLRLL